MDYKIKLKKFKKHPSLGFNCVFFSDRHQCDLAKTIANLPKNSVVIFREYDLNKLKRQELAKKTLKICQKFGHKMLIGKDFTLNQQIRANGVHFSDKTHHKTKFRRQKSQIYSFSCHNIPSIIKMQRSSYDFLFISPIFTTKSHLEARPLGLRGLKEACKLSKKPIFALGGVKKDNINQIFSSNAAGIGGINLFSSSP